MAGKGIIPPGAVHPKDPTPVGTHGFYLPTIKIWNMFADAMMEQMLDGFQVQGSVEDLVLEGGDGNCRHCGSGLIRTQLKGNGYFVGGLFIVMIGTNYQNIQKSIG